MHDLRLRIRKLSVAVAATLLASSFIAVLPASAATITAVGSLAQNSGSGKSTLAVTPQHVGDAFVLSIGVFPSSPTVSSVSGGGSTWTRVSYTTASGDIEEWLGAITTTGSSTITVTFSGSISGKQDELLAQEFQSSTGSSTTWALDVAGHSTTSSNSTTVTMPTLAPTGSSELYVDYSAVDNSGAAGSTSGFTYDVTSEGSLFAYNPGVSASVTPTASQSPTGTYTETAAILTATSSGGGTTSSTTLTASPSSSQNPATSITLTATVTTGATGTVNFELGGTSISGCSAKTLSSSVATCTTTALAAGTNSFVAIYSGDSTYAGSTSSTLNYVGLTPQATLTVTSTSGTYGTPLTLTTSGGSGTGAVTYSATNGTATGCSVSSGSLSSTSAGTCLVTATKASDGTYQSISSSATTVTLSSLTSSTTTLTASPSSPQNPGTSITLTATVTTGATGTVNFELGGTSLSGCSAKALSASVATCTTTALAAGTNSFLAIYSGNSTYAGSTSSTLTYTGLTPNAPGTVTATASHGNATVSWAAPMPVTGVTIVGYNATAYSGSTVEGTCAIAVWSVSTLSCTIPDLPLVSSLSFSVTAASATVTGPASSTSSAGPFSLASSTTSLSVSGPTTQNIGAPISMSAVVTSGATGTVSFDTVVSGVDTAITGCATQAVSAGVATCTTRFATAGGYSLQAVYSGDTATSGLSNYTGSSSSTVGLTISSTTLTVTTSPLTIATADLQGPYGTPITLSTAGGGTGTVTYSVTNGSATGCSLSVATLSTTAPGTCLVIATQANDSTHLGQSTTLTTVNFYWYYSATDTLISSYYSCPGGEYASGSECYQDLGAASYGYYCSAGGTLSGSTCTLGHTPYPASYGWHCGNNANGGSECLGTDDGPATLNETWAYECVNGGTLVGTTCDIISGGSDPNIRRARALHHSSARDHRCSVKASDNTSRTSDVNKRKSRASSALLVDRKAKPNDDN